MLAQLDLQEVKKKIKDEENKEKKQGVESESENTDNPTANPT